MLVCIVKIICGTVLLTVIIYKGVEIYEKWRDRKERKERFDDVKKTIKK